MPARSRTVRDPGPTGKCACATPTATGTWSPRSGAARSPAGRSRPWRSPGCSRSSPRRSAARGANAAERCAPRGRGKTCLMRLPRVHRGLTYLLGLAAAVAVAVAAGCGDEEESRVGGDPDPEHVREVARNPHALTCHDVTRQSRRAGARLVIRVQTALTREPALRGRVAELGFQQVSQSMHFALKEVCRGRDPSFKPARLAADGVRRGKYVGSLCLGPR